MLRHRSRDYSFTYPQPHLTNKFPHIYLARKMVDNKLPSSDTPQSDIRTTKMPPLPFLDLPIELRLQVYGYIKKAVPRTAPMSDYGGIYLCCRQSNRKWRTST